MLRELLVIPQNAGPYRIPLGDAPITIGSASANTLSFPDDLYLSRHHALVQKRDRDWVLVDLGGSKGTLLNGVPIELQVPLAAGDRIQTGGVTIVCVSEEQSSRVETEIPPVAPSAPSPTKGRAALAFSGRKLSVTVGDPTPFTYGRASALFRANSSTGEDVCIKLFPHVRGDSWTDVAAFEREVLAQSNLDHPNILPVLDYGLMSKPHGNPFLVLPYCTGGSLRDLLRDRSFYPLKTVLPLLEQIAAALDYAHASGFIHGDVKPENVLLSSDRKHVYLSDFGMSNVFAIQERFSTVTHDHQGGTTAYLSPEQISEGQRTPLSDIYAFAVTAYELLTGHIPFDPKLPAFRQMMAKVMGEIIDPRRFNPQLSDVTTSALLLGLHRDPLKRPRTASQFCSLVVDHPDTPTARPAETIPSRHKIVVSYSHLDKEWLERIRVHLRPIERQGLIELWDDTRIRPGMSWREEIEDALQSAASAIILVSANFLASDFCTTQELPQLLKRASANGVKILPVILSPCQLETSPALLSFQAVNPPSRTLIEMDQGERERVFVSLLAALEHTASRGGTA